MNGSTRKMMSHLVEPPLRRGVAVKQYDLAVTDIGKLDMFLVDAVTIISGTPTVSTGSHPNVAHTTLLANALKPKERFASIIGSYGWGGESLEQIAGMLPNLKVEILEPVLTREFTKQADLQTLENLASIITQKHKEN